MREDRTIGGTLYTTEYSYDLADNLIGMVYPSGRILTYVRDALGRVTSVTTKNNAAAPTVNVATSIAYMPFGPIASLIHGNALAATFTWDQDYRLTGIVTAQGGTTIQNLAYGYNLADNVTAITDNLASGRNQSFTLDDLQRLTAATGAYGSLAYSYDAADNRLTRNLSGGPAETFTYGTTNNRLQSAAVTGQPLRSFTTNAAGDITLDDRGAGNTVTIAIGADARPQTIAVAGAGATTVTYKHNAFGERVSRVEGATTTHFHYDQDGRLIAESDGTGVLIREYLWLGDKPLGLVVGPAGSPTLYFVHDDHLERVQKITDATQAIVWDGQFTPYGRTHAITGTVQNPLRFPGQWADPAAGYFYNYMRDYDPTLARYLSSDPIGTRGGRNKFGYADARPTTLIDPRGLARCRYSISAHTIVCVSNDGREVVQIGPKAVSSGTGQDCTNNPECWLKKDEGPVPPGNYVMVESERREGWWWLEEDPLTRQLCKLGLGRCGFFLHLGTISLGCITVQSGDEEARKQFQSLSRLLKREAPRNTMTVYR